MSFRILPLPTEFLDKVRVLRRDDQGQQVQPFTSSTGGEPLRCCLRRARPGEELALVSFSPFALQNAFKELGPIYVHVDSCPGVQDAGRLSADFDASQLSFRAYSHDQVIVGATLAPGTRAADTVAELLTRPDVAHVDARFAGYGCFLARCVRA